MEIRNYEKIECIDNCFALRYIAEKDEDIFTIYIRFLADYCDTKSLKVRFNKNNLNIIVEFKNAKDAFKFTFDQLKIMSKKI